MLMSCGCFIVPKKVLDRFANDKSLPAASRKAFANTRQFEKIWRELRQANTDAAQSTLFLQARLVALAAAPKVAVYDCKHSTSLPGTPIASPATSSDGTAKRTFKETTAVAKFYKAAFGRNSVDNAGMTLLSSIHYDVNYNNAFWNGSQMTYGDGDGQIFVDFTKSNDVIGHELTHGVTQYTAGLEYEDEPGALNESISDVFGSMFRQWEAGQVSTAADWLIGAGIMGPAAKQRGYTCLRDMANPGATHCLSRQPKHYKKYVPGGDPHTNSGIPNYAFYLAATAAGGKSWQTVGKVWYAALTDSSATSTMKFRGFAKLTRAAAKRLFPSKTSVYKAVDAAWKGVGIS